MNMCSCISAPSATPGLRWRRFTATEHEGNRPKRDRPLKSKHWTHERVSDAPRGNPLIGLETLLCNKREERCVLDIIMNLSHQQLFLFAAL